MATIRGDAGERTLQVAVDTGATLCVFPPSALEAAGIGTVGARRISMTTASGDLPVAVVTIPAVRVGRAVALGVEAALHELPASGFVDGLLGLSFLRRFNITIDFVRGWLNLESERRNP